MAGRGNSRSSRGGRRGSSTGGGVRLGGFGGAEVVLDDPCDITVDAPLQAVQREAITKVKLGDTLGVTLRGFGTTASVVCVRPETGEVVGSPTFEGIAKMIRCIDREHSYIAQIIDLDGSDCTVRIMRSKVGR